MAWYQCLNTDCMNKFKDDPSFKKHPCPECQREASKTTPPKPVKKKDGDVFGRNARTKCHLKRYL